MSNLSKQEQNHIGNALIFMVRYSLPRKTAADMATTSALKALWSHIPEIHRKQIVETIESEKDLHDNDPWLWNEFLKFKEIELDNK